MVDKRRSPLFSAVVLAGAALTAAQACGSETEDPSAPSPNAQDGSSGGDTQAASDATPGQEDATASDAAKGSDSGSDAPDDGNPKDACPPDSEIPTPPCVLIL